MPTKKKTKCSLKKYKKKKNKMAYTYEMPLKIPPKEEAQCLQKRKRNVNFVKEIQKNKK